jgi:hypothetical protein
VSRLFHVTSVLNRESILMHGLDWTKMGPARGIAGSQSAEAEGCFLGEDHDVDWFVRMNNTGTPVDVWAVDGVDEDQLVTTGTGYRYLPGSLAPECLTLVRPAGPVPGTQAEWRA